MPIDFPNSPTTNQEFTATGRTWIYDGAKWVAKLAYGAHGATHAASGTDAVLLEQSQVNTLPATLAAKASLTGAENLTNKTLSAPIVLAPVITNGLINGPVSELFVGIGTGFAGYTYYASTNSSIQYIPAVSTNNGAINLTYSSTATINSVLSAGQTMTLTLIISNGATAYAVNSVQVDGTATGVTTRWAGGTAPTGSANSRDVYTFTIVKWSSATFDVFASVTKFA